MVHFVAPSASFSTRITTAETELGNTLLSSSAQISDDISGSLSAAAIVGLGAGSSAQLSMTEPISSSAQIAQLILVVLYLAAIVGLGANIVSSSAQVSADISGSFTGELSGSHIKFVGGGVSGSAASFGSFGRLEIAGRLAHAGDPDTRILFTDDDVNITVGNVNMVDFTQDT